MRILELTRGRGIKRLIAGSSSRRFHQVQRRIAGPRIAVSAEDYDVEYRLAALLDRVDEAGFFERQEVLLRPPVLPFIQTTLKDIHGNPGQMG